MKYARSIVIGADAKSVKREQQEKMPKRMLQIYGTGEQRMNDSISRQATIELIERMKPYHQDADDIAEMIANMPSALPETLTDKEQRIFLAAMAREEKVCKEVDDECCREPYEDSLVRICHEITRKVKGALWTI